MRGMAFCVSLARGAGSILPDGHPFKRSTTLQKDAYSRIAARSRCGKSAEQELPQLKNAFLPGRCPYVSLPRIVFAGCIPHMEPGASLRVWQDILNHELSALA